MVKTAEHRPREYSAGILRSRGHWTLQSQAAVRSIAVVVLGKFGEHGLEVALVDRDDVVKTLGSNGRTIRSPIALE